MEGQFQQDIEEIKESVEKAEVLSLFFPTFRKALLIDTRSNEREGPMVRVVPMVGSPQERLRTLRRLRPGFPRVHNLTVVPWPRYVGSLVRLGVWDRIVGRFVAAGQMEAVRACEEALEELRRLEKAELAAVVLGQNYHTIWSAPRQ